MFFFGFAYLFFCRRLITQITNIRGLITRITKIERIIISVGFYIDKFVKKTSVLLYGGLQSNKKEITK